jgi:alpha-ketoglutaric semialdehyde dehydrogenase
MTMNYIAGEWVGASQAAPDINPSNNNDVVGEFARASAAEAESAIAAAHDAFPAWSRSSIQLRHDLLKTIGDEIIARKDELGRLLAREEGKTLPEGVGEVMRAGQIFQFFAGETLRLSGEKLASVRPNVDVEITREPIGVVGLITPWNFPIAIPAWKIAPALAYGNTVVFKPAELVPASAHALSEIIVRAGVPTGVFNLVMGRGSVVGEAMLNSPRIAAISFTGSVATGRKVAQTCIASDPMKKMQLEMGGKNPLVVLDDADLKVAVECAVNGAFFSTGQRCTASSRLIVTEGIHDRFVDAMAERMKGLVVDDALKPGTQIGPVVDQNQLDQDLGYIRLGQDEGAKLAFGGELLDRENPGFYLAPALFTEVDNRMRIAREEIFGPVATVTRAKDYEEALEIANDTQFGLSAGICTTSLKHASHFKRNAEAGMVMVNLPTAGVDYHVPFGGRKGSSYGPREQGRYAQEFHTTVKTAYTFDGNGPYVPKTRASE